ncbi:hypothetical protein [Staphylococcus casei]|uniref:Phage protein n=1 Tax=Staphylococcus casei TaxID=201828 RepID=A0ABZ2WAK5_9STAP
MYYKLTRGSILYYKPKLSYHELNKYFNYYRHAEIIQDMQDEIEAMYQLNVSHVTDVDGSLLSVSTGVESIVIRKIEMEQRLSSMDQGFGSNRRLLNKTIQSLAPCMRRDYKKAVQMFFKDGCFNDDTKPILDHLCVMLRICLIRKRAKRMEKQLIINEQVYGEYIREQKEMLL